MTNDFRVTAAAGSYRESIAADAAFPHRWTEAGVSVATQFTGAHLLHLATAACVLNDVYREAAARDVPVNGVRVTAEGSFDTETWRSTGIRYAVEVDSPADVADLLLAVDAVAEIPKDPARRHRGDPRHPLTVSVRRSGWPQGFWLAASTTRRISRTVS